MGRGGDKPSRTAAIVRDRRAAPSGDNAEQRPDAGRQAHGERTPERDAQRRPADIGAAGPGADGAQQREKQERRDRYARDEQRGRHHEDHRERHGGARGEGRRRRQRRLYRTGGGEFRNAELVARVRAKRILRHELIGDPQRQLGVDAALHIDPGEFVAFEFGLRRKFGPFPRKVGPLGVRLRTDRHIFARRHGHRAGDKAGGARDQHLGGGGGRRGHADDQAGGRDDAVIGAEHGRTQPADAGDEMVFGMDVQAGQGFPSMGAGRGGGVAAQNTIPASFRPGPPCAGSMLGRAIVTLCRRAFPLRRGRIARARC